MVIPSIDVIIHTVLLFYALGAVFYFWGTIISNQRIYKAAFILASIGCILNLAALIARTVISSRVPLCNGYEFILSFTWITVVLYLGYELKNKIKSAGGGVMLVAALLILSLILLMKGNFHFEEVTPLMPALKSPWLSIHVITAAAAYAAFTLAAGFAAVQLLNSGKRIMEDSIPRIIAGGFALLSLSIVFGAIWAEQAWGSYWTWDPKETWALVTWIIYALYLHLHKKRDWKEKNANLIVLAGYVLVLFTFYGVNYLLPGLHSYAMVVTLLTII